MNTFKKLTIEKLNDPKHDEWCNHLIRVQCQQFQITESKVREAVNGGKTQHDTQSDIVGLFDKGPGHESQVLTTFQNSLPRVDELRRKIDAKDLELQAIPEDRKYTSGKAVTNIPPEEKTKQWVLLFFAALCTIADITNYTIFNHNTVGYSWLQSFLVPFGGIIALSFGIKMALDIPKRRQPAWFHALKGFFLIIGIALIGYWAFLYSQYAMGVAGGIQLTGMAGGAATNNHSGLMLWCATVGLALIAAYGVGKVQDIRDQYTEFNGVTFSEEYLQKQREVSEAQEKYAWVAGRRAFTDSLLQLISDTRDSVRSEAGVLYQKIRGI